MIVGANTSLLNDYCEKEGIIHEVTPPYSPESNELLKEKIGLLRNDKFSTC